MALCDGEKEGVSRKGHSVRALAVVLLVRWTKNRGRRVLNCRASGALNGPVCRPELRFGFGGAHEGLGRSPGSPVPPPLDLIPRYRVYSEEVEEEMCRRWD